MYMMKILEISHSDKEGFETELQNFIFKYRDGIVHINTLQKNTVESQGVILSSQLINMDNEYYQEVLKRPTITSQIERCKKLFKEDSHTRQSVINFWLEGEEQPCCWVNYQFLYRNKTLTLYVFQRSMDVKKAWRDFGLAGTFLFEFSKYLRGIGLIVKEIKIECFVASLHYYMPDKKLEETETQLTRTSSGQFSKRTVTSSK